ncbi:DEKNAAC101962 [Brettanomyces naardenensis]|uniref:DEKNAAC101962 n=1 Tax=Brettanomyces naardenensis TaxID=13370 RepID=A0A448YJK3_BRENA|nr:DEKNAAC101962 [Brettanomyces naardenensis]
MLRFITSDLSRATAQRGGCSISRAIRLVSSASPRYKSASKFNEESSNPEDAADATSTMLSEAADFQKRLQYKNRLTWWEILQRRAQRIREGKRSDSDTLDGVKTTAVAERTRGDSFSYVCLPFKDDLFLRDFYINSPGRLRFGHLFQDLDALAGRVAARHCKPAEPMNVTASIDRIYVTKKIDEIDKYNFVLAGYVTYTGRSSMEICIKGFAYTGPVPKDINKDIVNEDADKCFISANFTFVARNPITHKAHAVNKILPTTEKEWADYKRAESHNAAKKMRAKSENLNKVPPTGEESRMIHHLFFAARAVKAAEKKPENVAFMEDTRVSATQIQQPQYRNRNGFIFGGYLLRQTFELAYCAAGAFSRAAPRFVSLDNTTFSAPVPVGCVLFMDAEVCYAEHVHEPKEDASSAAHLNALFADYDTAANEVSDDPHELISVPGTLIQVKVATKIRSLSDAKHLTESGKFVYSFFVPRDASGIFDSPGYSSVIPVSYGEMIDYVEGRRRAYETAAYAQQLKLNGDVEY